MIGEGVERRRGRDGRAICMYLQRFIPAMVYMVGVVLATRAFGVVWG